MWTSSVSGDYSTTSTVDKAVQNRIAHSKNANTNGVVSLFDSTTKTEADKANAYSLFAKGMLDGHFDKDKNGEVTVDEFVAAELDPLKALGGEENPIYKKASNWTTNFAQILDMNQDGKIDQKELAFFYEQSDMADNKKDGRISVLKEAATQYGMMGANMSDTAMAAVVEKHLNGENLTPAEMQVLEASRKKMRGILGGLAGINTNA